MKRDNAINNLHVICYKWGEKYSSEYVNILCAMVRRHLTIPHSFHCITDNPTDLASSVVVHELPDVGVEGIWRKLMTFQNNFLGLQGEYVVSIDLDVVVVDSLDFLADHPEIDLFIGRNWARHNDAARASGAIYRLRVGSHSFIWERFINDAERSIEKYHGKNRLIGEQNWLDANIETFNYFPAGKVVSFKRHCKSKGRIFFGRLGETLGLSTSKIGKAVIPEGAAIISFHGDPLPPDVMNGSSGRWRHAPFVEKFWHE